MCVCVCEALLAACDVASSTPHTHTHCCTSFDQDATYSTAYPALVVYGRHHITTVREWKHSLPLSVFFSSLFHSPCSSHIDLDRERERSLRANRKHSSCHCCCRCSEQMLNYHTSVALVRVPVGLTRTRFSLLWPTTGRSALLINTIETEAFWARGVCGFGHICQCGIVSFLCFLIT